MIQTDEQRRWWFATHPEYSWSWKGAKNQQEQEDKDEDEKVRPEEVDAYVVRMLQYADGPVAELLKSVKRNFGTEGETKGLDHRLASLNETGSATEQPSSTNDQDGETTEGDLWHAIVKGFDDTLQNYGLGWGGGLSNPSRKLGRNMIEDGVPRPSPNHDAHHIVPAEDSRFPGAEEARKILQKFKIDLYNSANGVWLPRKPEIGEGAYHPGVHTKVYYREFEQLLREAGNRDHAIEILQSIGRRLSDGTFPK